MNTQGADASYKNLLSPGLGPAAATASAGAAAGGMAAAAAATANRHSPTTSAGQQSSQPPMRQTNRLDPLLISAAAAARDSNRVSVFRDDSAPSSAFTPSPVTPSSPGMLSPGAVAASRPVEQPPDPRIVPAADARLSRGSISSISTGSAISAALSPGQMAWPMPPGTPPAIRHPDGPQYVTFQKTGETVVRINQTPRSSRRSSGYYY
ncbi:hypothetical protein VTG60DRAFT_1197 [Thermothelomyces hinnuleus]